MKLKILLSNLATAVFLVAALVLIGCTSDPEPSDFRVGMSRQELLNEFGEPSEKQTHIKSQEHFWGPIEHFWASVPTGEEIEIWYYPSEGGTTELYFLDGSSDVKGIGFAPDGVVY